MNEQSKPISRWKWPTRWQWLVIVWTVVLNTTPYFIVFLCGQGYGNLDWLIWAMLSGPFGHTGMLSFFLIAGGVPIVVRRLTFAAGMLVIVGIVMTTLEFQSFGTVAWFFLEAATLVPLVLLSAWLFNIPMRPQRWSPQFSLVEILMLSGLMGIFLFMARLAEADDLEYWRQAQDTAFITFSISTGVYLLLICLTTICQKRKSLVGMFIVCIVLWGVYPLIVVGILVGLDAKPPLTSEALIKLFYPTFAFQLMLAWGTFFPIRAWLPGVLKVVQMPPTTAAQCKSDTLADAPESCPQSEHTGVPD